ncbi:MAG: serine/threonine protein kinase, partial [Myxococcales bacterium]|nr:serine/threonine protein kinase [Myxococcales bacterium]
MSLVEPAEWRCVTCGREYVEREAGDVCPEDDTVLVPRSTAERFAGDAFLGRRFADDFLIFDILGLGGFGAVYRAVEPAAGRQVAIKTIRPGAERHNADARARFAQEARLLRQLDNPHIVRVLRSGETADGLYMALELVPGRSLKRVMRSHTALSPRRVVHITEQILDALCHAHAMGLIHRDLKPANVLVVERADDAVKVIDFGIAKVLEADDEDEGPKTGTGLVLGTVRYMAPEQLRQGGVVGPASDLYAVGIMFYEMLTGKAPFDGSQAEIAAAHLYQPAPPLPEGVAPDSVRDWLARVLRKEPTDRFSDAKATRAALIAAMPADETAEDLTIPVRPDLGGPLAEADRETSGPLSSGVSGMVSGSLDTSGQGVVRLVTPEDGAADPTDGPVAAPRDGSTLPGHQPRGMAPPVPQARSTIESPAPVESFTAALADLPDLDPGLIPRPGESSGTIQQTLGELGLAPPGEGRRRRWLAPAVVALVLLGVVL